MLRNNQWLAPHCFRIYLHIGYPTYIYVGLDCFFSQISKYSNLTLDNSVFLPSKYSVSVIQLIWFMTLFIHLCSPKNLVSLRKLSQRDTHTHFCLWGHQECGPTSSLEDHFNEVLMVTCVITLAKTSASLGAFLITCLFSVNTGTCVFSLAIS